MKLLAIISRILLGIVFIFSGFVKAVDPLGSTYKFEDYFTAFNMSWLDFTALPLAIILSGAEFIIGIALFTGLKMRITSWAAFIFMVFFTILTFFLAIFNPVTDCGCFGDAIILTNWETFFKNLIFMVPTSLLFIYRNKFESLFSSRAEWGYLVIFTLFILAISTYGYRHLPILDFRPYNIGTYIPDKMIIPEGAPVDEYESIFYYEKEGIVKAFDKDNYPWQDTTWKFVDAEHRLVKEGYRPPIHDFIIESDLQGDITDLVLHHDGYYILIIAYSLNKANGDGFIHANKIASYYEQFNIPSICLTSSINEEIEEIKEIVNPVFDFYNTDEITLKTIIRSNPGIVILHKGTIIDKLHFNDFPTVENLNENIIGTTLAKYKAQKDGTLVYALIFFSILLISIYGIVKYYFQRIWLKKS